MKLNSRSNHLSLALLPTIALIFWGGLFLLTMLPSFSLQGQEKLVPAPNSTASESADSSNSTNAVDSNSAASNSALPVSDTPVSDTPTLPSQPGQGEKAALVSPYTPEELAELNEIYPIVPDAEQMVLEILVPTHQLKNIKVLDAMMRIPRAKFVPKDHRSAAYLDYALPIGHSQTISPPFVVAYMTEQIDPQPTDKVLEIGTGSGYQAAVLSPLVSEVYTIEIVPQLGKNAAKLLKDLDFSNVHVKVGDGYLGWPEAAPFDKIIVTCSPEDIPQPLIDQLKEGGQILIPTGDRYHQLFYRCTKVGPELKKEELMPAFFVPMTGQAEDQREKLPDPDAPSLVGGDFEEVVQDTFPIGWYYVRNAWVETTQFAPQGEKILIFDNLELKKQQRLKEIQQQRFQWENRFSYSSDYYNEQAASSLQARRQKRQFDEELTSHAFQGFPINGQEVKQLEISCYLRASNIDPQGRQTMPVMVLNFFDEDRVPLGDVPVIAVPSGSFEWEKMEKVIPVPKKAREGSIQIGILSGTGHLEIDDILLKKSEKAKNR